MIKTSDGYKPDSFSFRNAIFHMDSLKADKMPLWDFMEIDPLLDSSRMSVNEWNKIASIITDNNEKYDGFVILHGTDTMAYSASALSFMLKGLNKPVILTGSQIPLCEVRSDGRDNLITSLIIAGGNKVKEVCIYFGGVLIRGNRASKYSAEGMRAFDSANYPVLASAGISIQYNEPALLKNDSDKFIFTPFKDIPIGVIRIFPGFRFDLFKTILTSNLKGVVIETFGSGNIPDDKGTLLPILDKAKKNGVAIVVCSQCPQARVNMNAYEAGSILAKAGLISGKDMTSEAAVCKLYYLFSIEDDIERIKQLMEENIAGELSV